MKDEKTLIPMGDIIKIICLVYITVFFTWSSCHHHTNFHPMVIDSTVVNNNEPLNLFYGNQDQLSLKINIPTEHTLRIIYKIDFEKCKNDLAIKDKKNCTGTEIYLPTIFFDGGYIIDRKLYTPNIDVFVSIQNAKTKECNKMLLIKGLLKPTLRNSTCLHPSQRCEISLRLNKTCKDSKSIQKREVMTRGRGRIQKRYAWCLWPFSNCVRQTDIPDVKPVAPPSTPPPSITMTCSKSYNNTITTIYCSTGQNTDVAQYVWSYQDSSEMMLSFHTLNSSKSTFSLQEEMFDYNSTLSLERRSGLTVQKYIHNFNKDFSKLTSQPNDINYNTKSNISEIKYNEHNAVEFDCSKYVEKNRVEFFSEVHIGVIKNNIFIIDRRKEMVKKFREDEENTILVCAIYNIVDNQKDNSTRIDRHIINWTRLKYEKDNYINLYVYFIFGVGGVLFLFIVATLTVCKQLMNQRKRNVDCNELIPDTYGTVANELIYADIELEDMSSAHPTQVPEEYYAEIVGVLEENKFRKKI